MKTKSIIGFFFLFLAFVLLGMMLFGAQYRINEKRALALAEKSERGFLWNQTLDTYNINDSILSASIFESNFIGVFEKVNVKLTKTGRVVFSESEIKETLFLLKRHCCIGVSGFGVSKVSAATFLLFLFCAAFFGWAQTKPTLVLIGFGFCNLFFVISYLSDSALLAPLSIPAEYFITHSGKPANENNTLLFLIAMETILLSTYLVTLNIFKNHPKQNSEL